MRTACRKALATSIRKLELWLLVVALATHPAEELLFSDLLHLPELFPFAFSATIDDVRRSPFFEVHRQGIGWDMVSPRKTRTESVPSAKRTTGKRRSTAADEHGKATQLRHLLMRHRLFRANSDSARIASLEYAFITDVDRDLDMPEQRLRSDAN